MLRIIAFSFMLAALPLHLTWSKESLQAHQWAFENNGQSFTLRLDDLTSLKRPGVQGEDLGNYAEASELVIVAVLDSGVDPEHPELASMLVPGGKNFSQGKENADFIDRDGHGTHVAGIIAAKVDGIGVRGVAQNARILPIKVIPDSTTDALTSAGISIAIAKGIRHAVAQGAKVINMSLGFPRRLARPEFFEAVREAHARGVLMVAAAGNDSTDEVLFPCSLIEVICVGAHGPDGAPTQFSNRGMSVDIFAPGLGILSTHPMNMTSFAFTGKKGYELRDGTSMAAPFVAGALANLMGMGYSAGEARARLLASARRGEGALHKNLDLEKSQALNPRALILPAARAKQKIFWDRSRRALDFELELVNEWMPASNVHLSLHLKTSGLFLKKSEFHFTDWGAGKKRGIQTQLLIEDDLFDSQVEMEVQIKMDGAPSYSFNHSFDVIVPTSGAVENLQSPSSMDLLGFDSWISIQGKSFHHIAVGRVQGDQGETKALQLSLYLVEPGREVRVLHSQRVDTSKLETGQWNLSSAKSLSETSQLALVFKMKATRAGRGAPHAVLLLNANLSIARGLQSIPTDVTYFKEEHEWIKTSKGMELFWYGIGALPPSEKKPFNPWKKEDEGKKDYRLYRLGPKGLETMGLPEGYTHLVAWLGQGQALLSKGENFDLDYAVSQVLQNRWSKPRAVSSEHFHHLKGILPTKLMNLGSSSGTSGRVAFSGSASGSHFRGHHRVSLLANSELRSYELQPKREFDTIRDVAAVFTGDQASEVSAFALTQYRIQYHDFSSGSVTDLDQRRFSFLPEILALKAYFPVSLSGNHGKIPALLVPVGFLLNETLEVIAPVKIQGSKKKLRRPAWYRLLPPRDCDALPGTAEFSGSHWLQLRCKNVFRFIKL